MTCSLSNGLIATHRLNIRKTVTVLVGSTVGPGLIRAVRRAPTLIRNKPFTGVTRKYGSIITAGLTVGVKSVTIARTNFNTSLNTRGFVSVGYHFTNVGPSTIIVITAIHTLGVRNNISGGGLRRRGIRTLGGNFTGLTGRVRGVHLFSIPIIMNVGGFVDSASRRVTALHGLYRSCNIRITLGGY